MKKLFSTVFITIMALGLVKSQTVIYYQDFSGGIPASWSNKGTSSGTANANVKFVYTTDTTQGSGGQYGRSYGTIQSPTRANGYITFDSDSLDEGSGTNTVGTAPAPQHVELTTSAIDITGYPKLRLQFYSDLANFQSTPAVAISIDSVHWTVDTLTDLANQTSNTATDPAKQKTSIDISSIVNGSNKVYIKFILDANYYFWAIDDISLIDLPNNDLSVTSFEGQSLTSQGLGLFFNKFPLSQADSITSVAFFSNIGKFSQPNTKATIALTKTGGATQTYVTTPPFVLPSNTDTVDFATLPTSGIGNYKSVLTVSSDSTDFDPANNRDSFSFAVTDSVYSINNSTALTTGYFLTRSLYSVNYRVGTVFEVTKTDTVTSVTTGFIGGTRYTHAGAVVKASIYPLDVTPSSITYTTPAVTTVAKTLVAGDLTAFAAGAIHPVTLKIDATSGNPVLAPGVYWVALEGVSTPDSNILAAATTYQTNGLALLEDQAQAGQFSLVSNTDAVYCNLNFGHGFNTLYCNFTRTPNTNPVRAGQTVTFNGSSNGGSSAVYTWDFTSIPGTYAYPSQTGRTVRDTFPSADSIQVCLTVTDGGSSAQTCKNLNVRDFGIGIQDVAALSNVSMVPNPTTGKVTISADGITGATVISITNMIGEEVKHFSETSNGSFQKTYNLADLSSGLYIVRMTNGGNTVSNRLSLTK